MDREQFGKIMDKLNEKKFQALMVIDKSTETYYKTLERAIALTVRKSVEDNQDNPQEITESTMLHNLVLQLEEAIKFSEEQFKKSKQDPEHTETAEIKAYFLITQFELIIKLIQNYLDSKGEM